MTIDENTNMKLSFLPVPVWTPPAQGPWRIRSTRPSGETYVFLGYLNLYEDRAVAQEWADRANRCCREGCIYDVVPTER